MNGQSPTPLQPTLIRHPSSSSEQEPFDMEKSTEQIYSAFFTLMRKAEEIDNRLDDVANREEAASVLEDNLNDREDELDEWEEDLHEREKALAEREERLMRAQGRLGRRAQRRTVILEEDRPVMREVLWKHGPPPPIVKVSDWLRRSEDFAVEPDEES